MENIKQALIGCLLICVGCSSDNVTGESLTTINTLADLVAVNEIEIDNVIACASGSINENEVIAYVYPRPGATDLQYFETETVTVDKNNYANYTRVDIQTEDVFNGYLKKFTKQVDVEKWVIISFRENEKIHLSNPIRLKHQSQNTIFGNTISIDQETSGSPIFNWGTETSDDDAIYFQVVSDALNNFISGTYTFEDMFQFYNLDNVVLNITEETPPSILPTGSYHFTLMAVSEDNWVNYLVLETAFSVE